MGREPRLKSWPGEPWALIEINAILMFSQRIINKSQLALKNGLGIGENSPGPDYTHFQILLIDIRADAQDIIVSSRNLRNLGKKHKRRFGNWLTSGIKESPKPHEFNFIRAANQISKRCDTIIERVRDRSKFAKYYEVIIEDVDKIISDCERIRATINEAPLPKETAKNKKLLKESENILQFPRRKASGE